VGGFGWGRCQRSDRDTIEDLRGHSLGIKDWVERGLVWPGYSFRQQWLDKAGCPEASIDIRIEKVSPVHPSLLGLPRDGSSVPDRVQAVLRYRAGKMPDDMRPITDFIVLARSHRGFAGEIWRFHCPGCGRRVADLYPKEAYFRCRKCCGVGYQSQRETPRARGLAKAARIKQRLGGTGEYGERIPERPKGMHRRTYERLVEQVEEAERLWNGEMFWGLQRFLGDYGLHTQTEQPDEEWLAKALQQALEKPQLLR
jgi:hypothetical protein